MSGPVLLSLPFSLHKTVMISHWLEVRKRPSSSRWGPILFMWKINTVQYLTEFKYPYSLIWTKHCITLKTVQRCWDNGPELKIQSKSWPLRSSESSRCSHRRHSMDSIRPSAAFLHPNRSFCHCRKCWHFDSASVQNSWIIGTDKYHSCFNLVFM